MRVGEVESELVGAELRCAVDVEPGPNAGAPFRLVVTIPRELVGLLDARADVFAAFAAPICGEPAPGSEDHGAPDGPGWIALAYDASAGAAAALVEPPLPVSHLLVVVELDRADVHADRRRQGIAALAAARGLGVVRVATNAHALARDRGRSEHLDAALWDAVGRLLPAFSRARFAMAAPLCTRAARGARIAASPWSLESCPPLC